MEAYSQQGKEKKTLRGLFWAQSAAAPQGGPPWAMEDDVMWWVAWKEAFLRDTIEPPSLLSLTMLNHSLPSHVYFFSHSLSSHIFLIVALLALWIKGGINNAVPVLVCGTFESFHQHIQHNRWKLNIKICRWVSLGLNQNRGPGKAAQELDFLSHSLWGVTIVPSQVALSARQIF